MDAIKNDLESLKNKYDDLQHMYEVVVEENYELKTILNYLNNLDGTSDSD
jgi:archaellum component FlaC